MTIRQTLQLFAQSFSPISDTPMVDARILVCHCLGLDNTGLMLAMDKDVPTDRQDLLEDCGKRRSEGEPVAYITGKRGFYECEFSVSKDTLIPRADTETLVQSAIDDALCTFKGKDKVAILDLCCGTGCIGISVAKVLARSFKGIDLVLSDLSEGALEVCRKNVKDLVTEDNITVTVLQGSLLQPAKDMRFDLIVSNPPYIATDVISGLEKQVQYEPMLALDGGKDGLDLVREISKQAKDHLNSPGLLQFEIGYDQGPQTKAIMEEDGFAQVQILKDLGDCDRVVKGRI